MYRDIYQILQRPHSMQHTHTTVLLLFWNLSGTTRVRRYQKGKTRKVKTNLDLLEQETVSGSSICWAICKSAPHPRQPRQYPTTQFFTGRMPFLPPNQQCQSTEGSSEKYFLSKLSLTCDCFFFSHACTRRCSGGEGRLLQS